ncbi:MAG: hypothetical protein M1829_002165 [Trizodia sp. TS-e1964]|nr:MAG: hypothetical protein M1829_002165 [Trizodia sp. TS-e1964]
MAKLKLYTNHSCPWAYRVHIALIELGIPFDEELIDLDKPREDWYLKINPRGQVPTLDYDGTILTESGVIAEFLADAYPSHLLPASGTPSGALFRARVHLFVDRIGSRLVPAMIGGVSAPADKKAEKAGEMMAVLEKDIEPFLADAAPFFGGSKELTLAEVCIQHTSSRLMAHAGGRLKVQSASFVLHLYAYARTDMYHPSLLPRLDTLPNFSRWAKAVVSQKSVLELWEEQRAVNGTRARYSKA